MKRIIAFMLALVLMCCSVVSAEDVTPRIDFAAMQWYAQATTAAAERLGHPYTMTAADDNGSYSLAAGYISAYSQTATFEEALTNKELPVNLLISYSAISNAVAFVFGSKTISETPLSIESYIDGTRYQGGVLTPPDGSNPATSITGFFFDLNTVHQMMQAQDVFLRLSTDKGTSFIEVSGANTLIPYCMLGLVCSGAEYSLKNSPFYLDKNQLWVEIQDWQPQGMNAQQTPSYTQTKSFQTDYEAIDKAAQSAFLLEVYDGQDRAIATGSGFVAFDKGTMITNEHVIDGAAYIIAYSDQYSNAYKLTELKAVDKEKDIALLEFDETANVQPLKLDSTSRLLRGQPVTAIGSPQGILNTVSSGNISNIVHYSDAVQDAIQFTAPISPGSSGGALFNEQGSVIGLCVSMLKEGEAMYYAIPIKYVEELYKASQRTAGMTLKAYNVLDFAAPKLTIGARGVILEWEEVPGATGYIIYRKKAEQGEYFKEIARVSTPGKVDSSAKKGMTYEYYIGARMGDTIQNSGIATITRPGATATPKPTATSKPTAIPNVGVKINTTVKASKGQYTISWTGGTAPYRITWKPADGKGESFSNSNIRGNSFTTALMIPGCRYSVTITDAKNKSVTQTVSVPTASSFRDGTLTANKIGIQISPRYDADGLNGSGGAVYIQQLYASDMLAGIKKGAAYGLYYRIDLPSFSGERTWMETIVFRAPNGYRYIWYADYDNYTFPGAESWWKWDCMGREFFQEVYNVYHKIPTGQYYIDMYWNGMLVKTTAFQVNQ